ncbi:hypothetical protein [Microbacterium karelineae]|uniref:hypothetical protein n=1 Tax=Microbacterium karelineae TaxID=2654283 RepID=UPI0012EA79D1|nr:hypothetical protein [Microbacterium karelineae]
MSAAHRLRAPAALPGIAPRIALAAAAAAGGLLNEVTLWQVAAAACGILAAIARPLRTGYLVAALVVMALLQQDPSLARACAAVLIVHAIHVLTSASLVIPVRARVTLRAARPGAIRFVAVQAIGQAAAILAVGLPPGPGLVWLAPAGAAALGIVALAFHASARGRRG